MVEIRRTPSTRRRKMADHFTEQVAKKEALRQKALRHKDETVWFGLGMIGYCRLGGGNSHTGRNSHWSVD